MGVYYSFSPNLNYKQVKDFLKNENLEHTEYKDNGDTRNVIEIQNYPNVDYLLFYYTNIDNLVAHSSHDLEVIKILERLSRDTNCEIDSDNDEFIVPFNK